jgi:hypothetical protein
LVADNQIKRRMLKDKLVLGGGKSLDRINRINKISGGTIL